MFCDIWHESGQCLNAEAAAFANDMNAALAFHEAVLPEWDWQRIDGEMTVIKRVGGFVLDRYADDANHPAIALFLADMAALIAKEEAK